MVKKITSRKEQLLPQGNAPDTRDPLFAPEFKELAVLGQKDYSPIDVDSGEPIRGERERGPRVILSPPPELTFGQFAHLFDRGGDEHDRVIPGALAQAFAAYRVTLEEQPAATCYVGKHPGISIIIEAVDGAKVKNILSQEQVARVEAAAKAIDAKIEAVYKAASTDRGV